MASNWRITFTLVDTKGLKTTLNYLYSADNLTLADEFSDANDAMSAVKTDLAAITDANFYSENLIYIKAGSTALPADADITDVAQVIVYLTGTGVLPKFATLRVPAPVVGIFQSDLVSIDKDDADLIAFVANFLDGELELSDGEHVVADIDDGIKGGGWASVKKNRSSVQSAVS